MHFRNLLLAAATIAAIAPAVSNASAENDALTACANALSSRVATDGSNAPVFKLKYRHSQPDAVPDYYGRRQYTFYLQARDAKTGMPLGRASCSADLHGTVVAFSLNPPEATAPVLAARK
jgi:hypothetical protein